MLVCFMYISEIPHRVPPARGAPRPGRGPARVRRPAWRESHAAPTCHQWASAQWVFIKRNDM